MKAKDLLKEIVKAYPDVVAIAQERNKSVFVYYSVIPKIERGVWLSSRFFEQFTFEEIIEWDSENWKENIVTINDLKDEEL